MRASRKPSLLIEDFGDGWEKEWFSYKPEQWARSTHKLYDETWKAPPGARIAIEVRSVEPNTLVVLIDEHAAAFDTAVPPVEARDMPADEDKPEDSGPAAANADRVDAADEPEPGTAASGEARTDAGTEDEASAAGETKPADDTAEPVLNVDALDEALDKTDDSAEATPPAEESDKSGARATTH